MLNVLFGLFLFGMLCSLCVLAFYRVVKLQQPLNIKTFALLAALALGSLIALCLGMSRLGYPPLNF